MVTTPNGVVTTGLNPTFNQGMWELISAVEARGGHVTLSSGVRSKAEQQALWNNRAGNPNPVAKPGTSLHEQGLAADLVGDETTTRLLHELAPKFGLTGIAGDPVHFQLATAQSPSGSGLEPIAPQPTQMTLPARFDVLANMLNSEGMTSPNASEGIDTTSMTNPSTAASPTANSSDGTLSLVDRLNTLGSMLNPEGLKPDTSISTAQSPTVETSASGIDRFMSAISGQESGGNYNAKNPSGASGKYQIMPSNWPSWSKEAGLASNAEMSPQNQETVARFKMQQYYQQFGDWGLAAAAWFAGPGTAARIQKNPALASTISDGNKSVQSYMDYARQHMGGQ